MDLCSHCHQQICEDTLAKVADLSLHLNCLACSTCSVVLDTTCFTKEGKLYCRKDFAQLFGPLCSGCRVNFQADESVRVLDDENYHLNCFKCQECSVTLDKGMNVGRGKQGEILCEEHYLLQKDDDSDQKIEDDEVQYPDSPEKSENEESDKENDERSEKKECKDGKRRGPRTNITAKQLEMLRNVFNTTPKPTRLIREQLAKDTQLSMRVIQVWFQNKRSKEKRMHQLRFMAGTFPRTMHPMFPPPNAVAYTYGSNYQQTFPPQFDQQHDYYMTSPESSNFHPFPSPPPQVSDFPSHAPALPSPSFSTYPSPPPTENSQY